MFLILLLLFENCDVKKSEDQSLKLWYDKPATDWMTEALPLGNGYIGAMFFGGINEEHIQFSEGTLWSGGPGSNPEYNFGIKKGGSEYLPEVRKLLKNDNIKEAEELVKSKFTGVIDTDKKYNAVFGDFGAQQTMGDIYVKVKHKGIAESYKRSLDIENALAKVEYMVAGEKYQRTFFGNYPDNVMVYEFLSSVNTDYEFRFETPHLKVKENYKDNTYSFQGKVADNEMGFETVFNFKLSDGQMTYNDGILKIEGAKKLVITHVSATTYKLEYPTYSGNDFYKNNRIKLNNIASKSLETLKKEHIHDYKGLFNRVSLDLQGASLDNIPTDTRLINYFEGGIDFELERLYFQYSRYLMISASRPKSMAMHLQGKWNNSTNPPWAADYHSNINLEMIYWPAELTNLSECHEPFLDYIESLVEPGKVTAKEFFGTRGWVVNTACNPFGYTSPGWGIPWGFFPSGAGWFSQHIWDHYDFTQDKEYLKNKAYPIMKEAALFWIDYLIKDENGFYVSCPSYSPEHGGISSGASMDHQIAWDLLNNCVKAAKVLGVNDEFVKKAKEVRDGILPPKIGKWGQLQEWKEDVDNPNSTHRHVSHLYALHPGNQISTIGTPVLAKGARTSLNARGDSGTGWSRAWKMNFWARLGDGNHAYKMFKALMKPVDEKKKNMSDGGGTYPNLLCAHPPFQLDGNMGGCSGIVEMLLQSHSGVIDILPALPDVWKNGSVKGLKTRGNFTLDIRWKDGVLINAEIKGRSGMNGKFQIPNGMVTYFQIPKNGVFKIQ